MSSLSDGRLRVAATPGDAVRPPASLLADQLPRVLAQDHFIRSYVGLCDEIWASVLERIDHLEWFFDIGVTPIAFVRWLGTWLGVTVDPNLPEDRQRALVRTAGRTLMWRGTRYGLEQLLSALTGATVEVVDTGSVAHDDPPRASQRVSVRLSSSGGLTQKHLLELIRGEVPANAIIDLTIDAERVEVPPPSDDIDQESSVRAEPEPHGHQGFLPPMRGRLDEVSDPEQPDA